jgi:hypothetical protein
LHGEEAERSNAVPRDDVAIVALRYVGTAVASGRARTPRDPA